MRQAPSNALKTVGRVRIQEWICGDCPNCTTTYGPPIGTRSYSDLDGEYGSRNTRRELATCNSLSIRSLVMLHATELAGGIRCHPIVDVVIFGIFAVSPDNISL